MENIIAALPERSTYGYYRTSGGAEIDLVVDSGNAGLLAIEIKRSSAPSVTRGFYRACEDLRPTKSFVVHAGRDTFPLGKDIEAISLPDVLQRIKSSRGTSLTY